MRTSYSPTRGRVTPLPKKPKISLCIVTHHEEHEWYEEIPAVVRMSFTSMLKGAHDYELIVWDNGSPVWFYDLLKEYDPDVFIRAYNMGNWNARRAMLKIARADIVNLADCDLLYSPDWMDRQMEILLNYPNVGLVHGSPNKVTDRDENTARWAKQNGKAELIPQVWERDYCISRSMTPVELDGEAVLADYKGIRAWACSRDMQFLSYREVIEPFYSHPSENIFDRSGLVKRIGDAGLYMFSTEKRTAIHIGNSIDETVLDAAQQMGCTI